MECLRAAPAAAAALLLEGMRVAAVLTGLSLLACGGVVAPRERAVEPPLAATLPAALEDDPCDAPQGITFRGRRRYVQGANYAWHHFGADFGGLGRWNQGGVRAERVAVERDLAALAAAGASVVRWWVFPVLHGDAILRDAQGKPVGLRAAALDDLDAALELAAIHDLYLMPTVFSFDAFRPADPQHPTRIDLAPLVGDAEATAALLRAVLRPMVRRASASPHAARLFAWDLFNEPEWVVDDLPGIGNFCAESEPSKRTSCVSHARMLALLEQMAAVVRDETSAFAATRRPLITVGAVSVASQGHWRRVTQDFYQAHFYASDYGTHGLPRPAADKPTLVGEFPSWGVPASHERPALDALQLSEAFFDAGFAGSLGWTYNLQDTETDRPALLAALRAGAARLGCRARF